MDKKKSALIIGGIAALGIAAYFFLGQKTVDDFGPSGGGASGQAAGYEGGGGAGVSYLFGGDTIQFPGGGDTGINDILKALMGGGTPEGESKKEAAVSGAPQIVGVFQKPADYLSVGLANKEKYGIPAAYTSGASQDGQPGIMNSLAASMGGVLDILFKPASSAIAAGATVKKTITGGGPSGGGVLGTSRGGYTGASGFVAPAPVAVLGQSGGSSGVPGSSQAAQYVQAKYGQPGSGYVVRGYSLTGVPLYKPAG